MRFPLAVRAASVIGHLQTLGNRALGRELSDLGSPAEHRLAHFLQVCDSRHLAFEPDITIEGMDVVTQRPGRLGVLLLTTHANAGLARVVLRVLHDRQVKCVVVSTGPGYPVCGSRTLAPCIAPHGAFLVAVRSRLRAKEVVCAMIDASEPTSPRAVSIETPHGTVWISDALLRVADLVGADIGFMKATVRGGQIVIEIRRACAACNSEQRAHQLGAFAFGTGAQCAHAAPYGTDLEFAPLH